MRLRAITIPPVAGHASGYDDAPAAYAREGLYGRLRANGADVDGPATVSPIDPALATDDAVTNIARLGANIAIVVAEGLSADSNVLITGSNCTALVGILAGFERALGPTARIGLAWFDAHGDFN